MNTDAFRLRVRDFYNAHGRHDLPWRHTRDPYRILVSEIMLQQTQVPRVIEKYRAFLRQFPDMETLASAPQDALLREWKGLGYNRRALNLKRAARQIMHSFDGAVPESYKDLTSLPGVGPYTATAIQVFAFNKPAIVIETNIRTVFIKHFCTDSPKDTGISDAEISPFIKQSLDHTDPRTWYWALMDYGAHIKQHEKNYNLYSSQYTKQSAFSGSNRENRSLILSLLLKYSKLPEKEILANMSDSRTKKNLESLRKEGFLTRSGSTYSIK